MARFFRRLKTEWLPKVRYRDFNEAKQVVIGYIMNYYNQTRPHTYNV